jgi:DNA-binding beta-propeller fold protein YncE
MQWDIAYGSGGKMGSGARRRPLRQWIGVVCVLVAALPHLLIAPAAHATMRDGDELLPAPPLLLTWDIEPWPWGGYAHTPAVDADGKILVTSSSTIKKFSCDGDLEEVWALPPEGARPAGAEAVAIGPNGDVFVHDSWNGRILRLSADGQFVDSWSVPGADNDEGLAVDAAGAVYVPIGDENRIDVFDERGELLRSWGTPDGPASVAAAPSGELFVLCVGSPQMMCRYSADGQLVQEWDADELGFGQLFHVFVDRNNNVYLPDFSLDCVHVCTLAGLLLSRVEASQAWHLFGVTVDPDGNVYATDALRGKVYKFGPVQPGLVLYSDPPGVPVTVDGIPYEIPQAFTWAPDTEHWLAVEPTIGFENRYPLHFQGWSDGSESVSRTIPAPDHPHALLASYVMDCSFVPTNERAPYFYRKWTPGSHATRRVAVDSDGNVYVTAENGAVRKYAPDGALLADWSRLSPSPLGPIAIGPDRSVYVHVGDDSDSKILRLDEAGNVLAEWEPGSDLPPDWPEPWRWFYDVTVNSENVVYTSAWVDRLQRFSSDGVYLGEWRVGMAWCTEIVAVPSGDILVARDDGIVRFSGEGELLDMYPACLPVRGLDVDAEGNIYAVGDPSPADGCRFVKLSSDGTILARWGSGEPGDSIPDRPARVAVSSAGVLYVTDQDTPGLWEYLPPDMGKYEFSVSASDTNPHVNVAQAAGGPRNLYLWATTIAPGLSAFEAGTATSLDILGFIPVDGVLNMGSAEDIMLTVPGCPTGKDVNFLLGYWIVSDDGDGGEFSLAPSSTNGILGAFDCETEPGLWDVRVQGFSSLGEPPQVTGDYEFSVSASDTSPHVNVAEATGETRNLYLWVTIANLGLSAFEAGTATSLDILDFVPVNGVLNVGSTADIMIAVPGCPSGHDVNFLLGYWIVIDDGGEFCLARSSTNGILGAVGCAPYLRLWDVSVRGFSSSGEPPCFIGPSLSIPRRSALELPLADASFLPLGPQFSTRLERSRPNPFVGTVTLTFTLATPRPVSLVIYDVGGRLIRQLSKGVLPAGEHRFRWDGRDSAGRSIPAGVYFSRFEAGDVSQTGKLVYLGVR